MKVLNLYAGVGGNRKNWTDVEVTAVELDERVAAIYQKLYPDDAVVVADAHQYLLDHYDEFDFIWSSPPCQTHSKMARANRRTRPRYPDLKLYEEVIFLRTFFKGLWVVENVVPYYEPLIEGQRVGRHLYWSNFDVGEYVEPPLKDFINFDNLKGKQRLMDWLGIYVEENIYMDGNHCPVQVFRNCVHPNEGAAILAKAREHGT
jgi:DNA (cytosine-5)-methyltransferase 1